MKFYRSMELKNKILAPMITMIIIIGSLSIYLLAKKLESQIYVENENRAFAKVKSIRTAVEDTEKSLLATASIFSQNRIIQRAYEIAYLGDITSENSETLQEAREFLRDAWKDVQAGVKNTNDKDIKLDFHFHLPPARSLLRTWRKKQVYRDGDWVDVSDDLTSFRESVKSINNGEKSHITGIEIGRGGLALRALVGVYDKEGKRVGSVE